MRRPVRRAAIRAKDRIVPTLQNVSDAEDGHETFGQEPDRHSSDLDEFVPHDEHMISDQDAVTKNDHSEERSRSASPDAVPNSRKTPKSKRKLSKIADKRLMARSQINTDTDMAEIEGQQRSVRKRFAQGPIENHVISLLGDHVSLEHALEQRTAWGAETSGPSQSLIRRFHGLSAHQNERLQLQTSQQREVITDDLQLHSTYLPAVDSAKVYFVNPETISTSDTPIELRMFDVHDSSRESALKSYTIHTGLDNRAITWLPVSNEVQNFAVGGSHLERLHEFNAGPGCIQIWSLFLGELNRCIQVDIVYLHDFGTTLDLKWCPSCSADDSVLGVLAGVFGDGTLRIWQVTKKATTSTTCAEYRKLDAPAYTFSCPETQCTTFDWLTSTRLAAGCANGIFLIWDLSSETPFPISTGSPHTTHVKNIVACLPGAEDVILTTSWDHDVKFSNIWNPDTDFLTAPRERYMPTSAAWSAFLNCAIVDEELNSLKAISMRSGATMTLAAMKGTITTIATNAKHPFLAVGDASGTLMIMNACRKTMFKKNPQFGRRLYELEWEHELDTYRFTPNFKVEELVGRLEAKQDAATHIYPSEVNVSSAAWNPNPGFEGLLASCTQRFVRIDDASVP